MTPVTAAAHDTYVVGPPTDPQLRGIGEHIIAEVHAAGLRALANAGDPKAFPIAKDPLEQLFARRLQQKPADRVRRAAKRAAAGPRPKALDAVDLASPVAVSTQLAKARPKVSLDEKRLRSIVERPSSAPDSERSGLDEEEPDPQIRSVKPFTTSGVLKAVKEDESGAVVLKPPPKPKIKIKPKPEIKITPYEGVRVRLHKLTCLEETSGGGADEIALAGIATAANGATHKINPFRVSDELDSGESVDFGVSLDPKTFQIKDSGPREFYTFPYGVDNTVKHEQYGTLKLDWPRIYSVTFLLAEIDNGGFPGFVNDLFNVIKEKVAAAVGAAVGAAIGAAAGTAIPIPGLGTAIGAAVGALVGWILGTLWGVFMAWWEDDEFVPITVATNRKNQISRFVNETSFASTMKKVWWKGHGGHYRLYFDWRMVGGLAES